MTALAGESLRSAGDFAAQMGLPLRPARDGSVSFVFAQAGTLTLTAGQDGQELHVSLLRRPARCGPDLLRAALSGAGLDAATGRLVQVGLAADEALIVSVRLAADDVSLQAIEACLELLRRCHDALP